MKVFGYILAGLFIISLLLGCGFMAGYEYHQPREIIVDKWHEPKIVEVEKLVEVIKTVEVGKYVHTLTDWSSLEELQAFLKDDKTNEYETYRGEIIGWDCDDLAIKLMDSAQEKGKRLSFVLLLSDETNKVYGIDGTHAVCGALIGNSFYYVSPATDEITKVCNLD